MISYDNFTAGVIRFVHSEMLPHLDGWKKMAVGAYLDLSANNAVQLLKKSTADPAVAMTGIFQPDGVDVERLYKAVVEHMDGAMEFNVPMIGSFVLARPDIEKLYNFMKGVI